MVMDGEVASGGKNRVKQGRDCGVGLGVIPTVGFGLFFCSSRRIFQVASPSSCHSHLSHCSLPAIPPSRPTVHNPLYKNIEWPSATLALYTNIKVPGQLWGLPCVFVLFCEFFFSFGVLEFALTMPFSPSRFVRERDVVMVPSSWDAT